MNISELNLLSALKFTTRYLSSSQIYIQRLVNERHSSTLSANNKQTTNTPTHKTIPQLITSTPPPFSLAVSMCGTALCISSEHSVWAKTRDDHISSSQTLHHISFSIQSIARNICLFDSKSFLLCFTRFTVVHACKPLLRTD